MHDMLDPFSKIIFFCAIFQSLFSKMKDSMRDMLSPSWLSDLVHNVKKDSPVAADRSSPMVH